MARYKFDQIAFNSTDKKKPVDEDKEHYIGLEHLDSGSLKVTRWGSEVAPKGEKLLMKQGDVLFGKRRAYQKKVAIAPFNGIFSAHGMVLRPRTEVVDPDFFPLFIASDYFLDAAIKISVGSLSPTINWRNLKELEFDLPSISVQQKLAKVLWAINDTKDAYEQLIQQTDELVKSQFIEMFGDPRENPFKWPVVNFNDIAESKIGLTYKPADIKPGGILVLRSGNIQDSKISLNDNAYVVADVKDELLVRENDILMCSRNGSAALVGKVALIPQFKERVTFGAFMTVIRSRYYNYLFEYFQQPAFREQISAGTSTINQITQKMLAQINLPLPPRELQDQFTEVRKQSDKSKFVLAYINRNMKELIQCLQKKTQQSR